MYGKPPPQGSGNGWSGWYKNWYFRSLGELSYVINFLEKNNLNWKTAETKEYEVEYKHPKGVFRTYRPDFIVENKYVIEVKPKNLINTPTVLAKKEAAKNYFSQKDLEFKIDTAPEIEDKKVRMLFESGQIEFTERYERLFRENF